MAQDDDDQPTAMAAQGGISTFGLPGGGDPGGEPGGGGESIGGVDEDIHARLQVTYRIDPLTYDLAGDAIDLNRGGITFQNTDVELLSTLGNLSLTRTFNGWHQRDRNLGNMGDWSLSIPRIQTQVLYDGTDTSGEWDENKACSGGLNPGPFFKHGTIYEPHEFWNGDTLEVPGYAPSKLMSGSSRSGYTKSTGSNWHFKCTTINGVDSFVGVSPDGLTYTFSQQASSPAGALLKPGALYPVSRGNRFMLVTKIEDRFGNEVNYNYSSGNLVSITSDLDGTLASFQYSNGVISTITVGSRVWQYTYENDSYGDPHLKYVTRPDGRNWTYDFVHLSSDMGAGEGESNCVADDVFSHTVSVNHPDGAQVEFTLGRTAHGRSDTPPQYQDGSSVDWSNLIVPKCSGQLSVIRKEVSGPGIDNMVWTYEYSQNGPTEALTGNLPPSVDPVRTRSTTVMRPDGSRSVSYHNRSYTSAFEGKLVAQDVYSGSTLKSRIELEYSDLGFLGDWGSTIYNNDLSSTRLTRQREAVTTYGSDVYTTIHSNFDTYGYAGLTEEYNSFSNATRFTRNTYYHDTTNWILGRTSKTELSENGSAFNEVSRTTFWGATHAAKSLPRYQYSNGRWVTQSSYDSRGRLVTQDYNGSYRTISYSNFYRGMPRTIANSGSTSGTDYTYLTYNEHGETTSTTDRLGNKINYTRNGIGRLTKIDPVNSAVNNTNISYSYLTSGAGITGTEAGMLVQTVTQGANTTRNYFDGLLRTVATKQSASGLPTRYQHFDFDHDNRNTFASMLSGNATETRGTYTTYDALGRSTSVNDPRSGSTSYTYLSNNRVRENNNRGHQTTTTYLAYGSPDQSMATYIDAAVSGTDVSMTYNVFGNLTAISQGGITEYRVYDAYQNLCKQVRPDVGNTAYYYNSSNDLTWTAQGSSVSSSTTSCDTSVTSSHKATYAYDRMGRVQSVTYGDSGNNGSYSVVYDANGNVTQLNATGQGVVTDYVYNSLGQLTSETMSVDSQGFTIGYEYDANGAMKTVIYPSGGRLALEPNAYGQPTRVGVFATNVNYHANGMVSSFSYRNGMTHSSTLNSLDQLYQVRDYYSSTNATYERYSYDANSNITSINDLANGVTQTMGYDAINRLTSYNGGTYNYDGMGNITSYSIPGKSLTYTYNSSKRLTSVSGYENRSFSYDDRGNTINDGNNALTFNRANQVTAIGGMYYLYDALGKRVKTTGGSDGTTYSMYNAAGQLIYEVLNGQPREYYYLGSRLVARQQNGAVQYAHTNNLGSVIAETTESRSVTRKRYEPYGENVSSEGFDVGYTGHRFDSDTGLNYMQARYYDPLIGRFYSNDPVGFKNPQNFNRYAYANNNPYKYTDPDGRDTRFIGGAGVDGGYILDMKRALEAAGISNVSTATNADSSTFNMYTDALSVIMTNQVMDGGNFTIPTNLADGEQLNLIGYSWGGVVAAQRANVAAGNGQTIDNLVLIGAPINGDLLKAVKSNPNIKNVHVMDLTSQGDPIYAGMSDAAIVCSLPSLIKQMSQSSGHFYYAPNTAEGAARRTELGEEIANRGLQ